VVQFATDGLSGAYLVMASSPAASSGQVIVAVRDITRRFARKWALRGVSLDVREGELVAIQGHNGSGKSTLLRIISTALSPTGGGGTVLGFDLRRGAADVRQSCALLGVTTGLYEDLSAFENLEFASRMIGLADDRDAILQVLESVGLLAEAHERVRVFSSGMQRRVALGRVLLQSPRLLLLDEPFNALDADGVQLVNEMMDRTRARGGAVIVVLHDPGRLTSAPNATQTMSRGLFVSTSAEDEEGARVLPLSEARARRRPT
jgi:heme exporter protein A